MDMEAQNEMDVMGGNDPAKALECFELAAVREAEYNAGICYLEGMGTEKNRVKALEHFLNAAHKGLPLAENMVGMLLFKGGDGIQQDPATALTWFVAAASKNLPDAQYNLGMHCNWDGRIGGRDCGLALEWFLLAKKQGHKRAAIEWERLSKENPGWCCAIQ